MIARKPLTFEKVNSIIYRDPTNKISDLKPFMKNLELRIIVLERVEIFQTKQQKKVTKFWIADSTGSAFLNVYDEDQDFIKDGDIIYMNGVYATNYKEQMVLHQGKNGLFKVIGDFCLQYRLEPNVCTMDWGPFIQREQEKKQ